MPFGRTFPFAGLWLCFFFAALSVRAGAPSDSPFTVNSWSAENGLPDNEVNSIIQTRDGYLWIGTFHGLARFDGNQFTLFDEMKTPALKSDGIIFLFEDHETNLWIGTQSAGLAVIQNGKIRSFEAETAAAGAIVSASEESGQILFYSQNGIARYQKGEMKFLAGFYSPQLYMRAAHLLIPSRDGGYWLLNGGIKKLKNDRAEKNFGGFPWKAQVTAACEDSAGNLIVGTLGEGVFWFNASGNYWRISHADGMSSDFVISLCLDNEGNLWVGTAGGGLDRIKRKIFSSPRNFHPLASQSVWAVQSVSEDDAGGFWAAITSAGVAHWQDNVTKVFQAGSEAWTVLVDRQQRVWVGSHPEGLLLFETNHFAPVADAGILGQNIYALFQSHDGRLWVGSGNGLGCWDGQSWKLFTTHDGLAENAVHALAEDAAGNLWIGTENSGLDCFNGQKFISYQTTNGLPGNDISCLYVDHAGILWVGTIGHGLARYENGKWTSFSASGTNSLASNSIGYLIGDDQGNLWIGSNRGLMRIPEKSLAGNGAFSCRVYGLADGLPTRECSSGSQPAAVRASDGELLFPTIEGLVSIDPSKLKPNQTQPVVRIESVLVDGTEQNTNPLDSAWSPAVTIPPGHEELVINYTALNFSSPQAVHFRYRLQGFQNGWTDAGDSRVARYPDLPPGHYHFQVIACNEDGLWNHAGAVMDVVMRPYFWQTNAFRIVAILLLLGAIVGIVRYVSTQNLHRQVQLLKHQEALERERARIARDLHDQLGANLTQVALLGEMAEADKNLPDEVESHTRQISQTARETTRSLDEIVWAINPSNDTLEGLANYVCKYASEYLALAGLPCRVDVPAQLPAATIPAGVRHNVFLAFKEAVHNVVKHAQAREVWIRLRLSPGHFLLQVGDNGRGLEQTGSQNRNGLRNMKKRMDDIGGNFNITSGASGGTLVEFTAPLKH